MSEKHIVSMRFFGRPLVFWGKRAFFICACLTFGAMGFFKGVYKPLAFAVALGGVGLIIAWRQAGRPATPWAALFPVAFAAYVAVVPGWPTFPDMQIADISLEMYILGLGLAVFFPHRAYVPTLCLAASICLIFFYWLLASPPCFMFGDTRLQLLFNHPNVLGLMASWCLAHFFCVWRQLPRATIPFVVVAVICLIAAILLTEGRSTYLSILLAIVGCGFILSWRTFRKVLLVGIVCWVCGYAALVAGGNDRLLLDGRKIMQEQSMRSRLVFWEAALDGFYSAPLTGLGHRTYGAYLAEHINANSYDVRERPRYPHNMYVDVLYSWGLIGAVMLVVVFVPAVVVARRRRDYFLPLSVLLMLGHGIFDSSLHMKAGLMVLFVPLGMLWGERLRAAFAKSSLVAGS